MTLAELLEQCRSDQAVYLRHAKTMTCRSMQAAKSGYVGRAAYAGAMVSRLEAMIAEGASELVQGTGTPDADGPAVAQAEGTDTGEGQGAVRPVPRRRKAQRGDGGGSPDATEQGWDGSP